MVWTLTITITLSIAVCPLISPDPTSFARAGYKRTPAQIVGPLCSDRTSILYGIDSMRLPRSQNGKRASPYAKSGLASLGEAKGLPRPASPDTLRVRACFQLRPDWPSPRSQSFNSRSYGSGLLTFLTYIVLLTRGCAPWRPAAVMGTTWGESLH